MGKYQWIVPQNDHGTAPLPPVEIHISWSLSTSSITIDLGPHFSIIPTISFSFVLRCVPFSHTPYLPLTYFLDGTQSSVTSWKRYRGDTRFENLLVWKYPFFFFFYFIHSLDGFTSLLNILFITKNLEAIASSAAGENFQVIRVPLLHVLLFHSFFGISRFLICLWCSGEQISIRMMLLRICDFHLLGNLFSLNVHFSLDFIFVSGYNDLCIFRGYLLFLFISNFIEK